MKAISKHMFPKFIAIASILMVAACAGSNSDYNAQYAMVSTPTVDYIESLDVYSAPHQDSFLNQLAMNYRSYAIYNARTSGYSEMGELFAQKAVAAFSGELPFPETLDNWPVEDDNLGFELHNAYNRLLDELKNDAADNNPEVAAEAQAKFDCWLSASASGQWKTAAECQDRFNKAMAALNCDGSTVKTASATVVAQAANPAVDTIITKQTVKETYYPETRRMSAMNQAKAREGVIVVNNVNIPEHLINPVPVQPMVFNQNIYGGDKTITDNSENCVEPNCPPANVGVTVEQKLPPMVGEEVVSRDEFINMMMALRSELAAINTRLDRIEAKAGEKTMIKVQQIPLEPKQHVMEEVFEVRFDFDKATIKPEYEDLIRKLATATQENKNIKVSVVGHTDTSGSESYNWALGGRRAEAVTKMLVKYGIPSKQIVAVSAGEHDLKVKTGNGVPNAENRRVKVVKEVHYTEPAQAAPIAIQVDEYSTSGSCGMYGCGN